MWGSLIASLARLLAVLALVTQALMPAAMASAAQRAPGSPFLHFCATPGDGPGAQKIGAELSALLADKAGEAPSADLPHDCGDCLLASLVPVPEPAQLAMPLSRSVPADTPLYEVRFAAAPRGPPLGSRAPPLRTVL